LCGDPAGAIVDAARFEEVDLVAIGSRGLGRLEGALCGSVSQKVAARLEASYLIVR
jgi:nucleotide-binding universal stress UspA family protein